MVGRLLSYWEGNFSGAMLNFGGVSCIPFSATFKFDPPKSFKTRSDPPKKIQGFRWVLICDFSLVWMPRSGLEGLATSVIPKEYALVLLQQLMEGNYKKISNIAILKFIIYCIYYISYHLYL